ncbi:MAG: RDD family protein [Acholeplasmataceae bacterium]|nr:RDD family protein [Acholeplasmataceae bacterium]
MYKKPIGLRLVAFMIDVFVMMLFGVLLNRLFGFGTMTFSGFGFNFNLNFWEGTILSIFYFGLIEFALYGKSIGKYFLHIEVTNDDLKRIDNRMIYLYRGVLKGLLIVPSFISFIFVLVRDDRKSIHDLVFKTLVIKEMNENEILTRKSETESD